MASFTMTASILGCPAVTNRSAAATQRRSVVVNAASKSVEGEKVSYDNNGSNARRNLMFATAAAAVCSFAAGMALADEPKPGTSEAKKKYAPVCVTNPTASICRN